MMQGVVVTSPVLGDGGRVGNLSRGECELCGWWSSDLILLACGCCRTRYGLDKEVERE